MVLSNILNRRTLGIAGRISLIFMLVAGLALSVYVFFLSRAAKEKFGSKKWELPARIYARPLELYPGLELTSDALEQELDIMQYLRDRNIEAPGSFSRVGNNFTLFTRSFRFEDSEEPARKIRVAIRDNRVASITDLKDSGKPPVLVRLDPALIGSFYPTHNQDRLWVKFDALSPVLIQTILGVEDRDFYNHHGVKPLAILRALIINLKEGRTVQGGSTLTQQLVKNLFLSSDQTFRRKFDEAIMALSLEWSYEKNQILEAYINEVYMGQDGKRAIHGFGMASRFYFGRSLADLRPREIALLTGLLKGPSVYDPRRYPDRARERRNIILKVMKDLKLIGADEADRAMKEALGVTPKAPSGDTPFPAFIDLVRRNLLQEYREDDLRSEGLRIFTTLDPQVQSAAESAVKSRLGKIEAARKLSKDGLQAAAIVTTTGSNEVLALTGDREPGNFGFNRALDARRSIGSLIKPAVYLTALSSSDHYTLITALDDSELRVNDPQKGAWVPQNYDRKYHGAVPLYKSLAHSYNVATVRLGMELGVENVLDTVRTLGVDRDFEPYPSMLLGAMSMTVPEVAQMYQTLASGGFYSPVRSIRGVYKPDGTPLQRYPLTVRENVNPGAAYLINRILQAVVMEGTARSLSTFLPRTLNAAGKTGTTNDLRDSWFAGFTGNRLAVVWVGRDDNKTCGLSGSSGALQVWGDMMSRIRNTPLELSQPDSVKWVTVVPSTGFQSDSACPGAVSVPFISGSEPQLKISCGRPGADEPDTGTREPETLIQWLKELF